MPTNHCQDLNRSTKMTVQYILLALLFVAIVCDAVSPRISARRRYEEEEEERALRAYERSRLPIATPSVPAHVLYPQIPPFAVEHRYSTPYSSDPALELHIQHERLRYQAELEDIHRARRHRAVEEDEYSRIRRQREAEEDGYRVRRQHEAEEDHYRRERSHPRASSRGRGGWYSGGRGGHRDDAPRLATSRREEVRETISTSRGRQSGRGHFQSPSHHQHVPRETQEVRATWAGEDGRQYTSQQGTRVATQPTVTPANTVAPVVTATTAPQTSTAGNNTTSVVTSVRQPPITSVATTSAPLCSIRTRNRESLDDVARLLRDAVMRSGFHRTLITWPMTTRYASLTSETQLQSLEYLRWCRDLLLAFTRYGSSRTRAVINNIEMTTQLREGVWNQTVIFEDWLERVRRQRRDPSLLEGEGWLPTVQETDDAMDGGATRATPASTVSESLREALRVERTRLLSLDGVSDPRRDRVEIDTDYGIVHNLSMFDEEFQAEYPRNDRTTTDVELGAQQDLVFSLEGRFPLMPRLAS